MSSAINTVARILKKASTSEKFPESSLPEYKPMPKLQRESSLPRIEVDRPRPLMKTVSDPGFRACASGPSYSLQNENYHPAGREDKTQKLLIKTKKVRGLRSFLWVKPQAQTAQASFISQLLPCLLSNLSSLSTGLALGYSTVLISWTVQGKDGTGGPQPTRLHNITSLALPLASPLESWIASVFWAGALLGSLLALPLTSRLGSRISLLLLTLPNLLGWILLACPPSPYLLLLGRLLTGISAGGSLPSVLALTRELVLEEHRPLLSLLPLPAAGLGTLLAYSLGLLLAPGTLALIATLVPVVLAIGLAASKDSPYRLAEQGRDGEALMGLQRLRGGNAATAVAELMSLQTMLKYQEATPDFIEGVLTIYRKHMDSFATVSSLVFFMVFSGKFSIDFYAIQVFQKAGSHHNIEHLSAIIVAFIYVVGCIIFILLDRSFPRKPLYIFSSFVSGAALTLFGVSGYYFHHYHSPSSLLPLLSLSIFMLAAPLGITSLPLTLLHDAFPAELRPLASSLSLSLGCLHLLAATQLFSLLQAWLGLYSVVWLQAGLCFLAALAGHHLLPDHSRKEVGVLGDWDKFAGLRKDRSQRWVSPLHYGTAGSPS